MPRLTEKEAAVKKPKRISFLPRPCDDLKQQLVQGLRDWHESQGITQKEAARRLGIWPQNLGRLDGLSISKLLNLWVKTGGHWRLTLDHPALLDAEAAP